MQKEKDTWYGTWFDSPYYHILYKNRDYNEAALFMENLTKYLKLPKKATILDLACGKGRHSKTLHELGYTVTGVDLSASSIASAKSFEKPGLTFMEHDMRLPLGQQFDAVFNLFTSFGYFEDENDNLKTIKAIKEILNTNGIAVIDFLNINYVAAHLVPEETKVIDDITFTIKKEIKNGYILKHIHFIVDDNTHSFTERVSALTYKDFQNYFNQAGLKITNTFGNYDLKPFNNENSDRLIMILKK